MKSGSLQRIPMFFGQCLKVNDGPSVIGRRLGSRAETGGWWVGRWNSATKKYGFTQGKHGDTERIRICRIWYVCMIYIYIYRWCIIYILCIRVCRSIHRKAPKRCNNMTLIQCNSSLFGWDVTFLSFLGCYLCIRIYLSIYIYICIYGIWWQHDLFHDFLFMN